MKEHVIKPGKTASEVLESLGDAELSEVSKAFERIGFCKCPDCGKWFMKDDEYIKYFESKKEKCRGHNFPCSLVFACNSEMLVCQEIHGTEHKHDSKCKTRKLNSTDHTSIDENGNMWADICFPRDED